MNISDIRVQMETIRKIIHIDMDAFFASVEQRDNPEYQNKPLVVGSEGDRGVVAAASYEARKFGIRSAMSSKIARQKCPGIIFVRPRFDVYKKVSRQVMDIFYEYTDLIEPLSIDEAFLDVTSNKKKLPSATLIAVDIKKRIKAETMLTASAGISINKFLAKIASEYKKPDGLFVIKPEDAETFVEELPVENFYGVGKVTAEKMHKLGIHRGIDLKNQSIETLTRLFGKSGYFYYYISRAIDLRPVNPEHIQKSLGAEQTFDKDITGTFALVTELYRIAKLLMERIKKSEFYGKTLTLKVKFEDFRLITRSKTITNEIRDFSTLLQTAKEIFYAANISNEKIRLLGLYISNTREASQKETAQQLTLDF